MDRDEYRALLGRARGPIGGEQHDGAQGRERGESLATYAARMRCSQCNGPLWEREPYSYSVWTRNPSGEYRLFQFCSARCLVSFGLTERAREEAATASAPKRYGLTDEELAALRGQPFDDGEEL